tara:strand:+ start:4563 stop:5597 length:1035 start_codon:yes stop_codon:yes gene_type:complete
MEIGDIGRRDFLKTMAKSAGALGFLGGVNGCLSYSDLVEERYQLDYLVEGESKEMSVDVSYPRDYEGSLPVVVFSHGIISSPSLYSGILKDIAMEGYFVVAPQHNDVVNFLSDGSLITLENLPGFLEDFDYVLDEVRNIEEYRDFNLVNILGLFWDELNSGDVVDGVIRDLASSLVEYRLPEFSKCVESIEDLSSNVSNVDCGSVGLMGHSLGGFPMLEELSKNNSAMKGGLFLSPASAFTSIENVAVPTRWMTGTRDWGYGMTLNSYEKSYNPSSFVSFSGAGHATFSNLGCSLEENVSCDEREVMRRGITDASISFFNCWLKDNGSGEEFLEGNGVDEYYSK